MTCATLVLRRQCLIPMNSSIPLFRGLFCALAAALALTFSTQLRAEAPGEITDTFTLPAQISAARTQEVIVRALTHRQWTVKSKADGQVVGYLRNGSKEATATFTYTAEKIDLLCTGWKINKTTGEQIKPEKPERWAKYLREDIVKYLGEPAKAP